MVHMMSTTRAGRPNKEKTPKTQTNQQTKTDAAPSSLGNKHQPTAEQMRLAQMIKSNKGADDPDLEAKIKQVADCTGRTEDDAYFALHDCDYDLSVAIEKLLENQDKQGEWQEMKGRKKKQAAAKSDLEPAVQLEDTKPERTERTNDRDHNDYNSSGYERSSSASRGRRNDRAPPRFQRAAGRGRNEDDRGDSNARDRGRGRGRGSRGRGRGRGSSGPRRDYNDSRNTFENGPQIDTWTNETADSKPESSFGTWGDMAEDWTNDEWTGSLKESKVFTPSAQESAKAFSGDNDAKMFSVTSIETQVFNSSLADSMPSPPSLNDNGSRYQHTASPLQPPSAIGQDPLSQAPSLGQDPLSQDPLSQDPLSQSLTPKPIGQNSLGQSSIGQMGQRLDLGMLLGSKPNNDSATSVTRQTEELAKQTADFMAQFQKQATESIKNAVGIGSSSQQGSMGLSQAAEPVMNQSASAAPQQPPQEQRPIGQAPASQQALQQRTKRTKLPPPSKIPQSAVVMPGGMNFGSGLDVKFGTWEQGESPSGFSFGAVTTAAVESTYSSNATSSLNNHMTTAVQNNHIGQQQQAPTPVSSKTEAPSVMTSSSAVTSQQSAMSAMLDSMTQQSTSQSPRPPAVFSTQQKNTPATPPKDYSQSTKISSPPEPIPFPPSSQTDRKSPYQPSGSSLASEPTGSSYSQSNYSSAYSSSAYKPSVPASTSSSSFASHQSATNGLSATAGLTAQSGLNNYQSSAFQTQSGYSSQTQNSLYQSNNPPSSFQSSQNVSSYQTGGSGYQSQSSGAGYQSTGYHSNRDSQSAPAFQSSASQSTSYQNSVSQSGSSTYQRDSDSQQSAYSSQSAYGSSTGSQKLSSTKLSDSINKLSVKDSTLDQSQSQFDSGSAVASTPASLSTGVSTTGSITTPTVPIVTGSVSVSAVLGLTTPTANSVGSGVTSTISLPSSKSTSVNQANSTTKAPPNLPPGVPPLIGQNMYIGQHGFPMPPAFGLQQAAMYSYEDLLLSQQRLPMPSYYDNLPFQPPTTLAGMDHSKLAPQAAVTYNTGAPDTNKLNRVDAQSPTNTQTSQPQAQTQSTAHGQTFISPHSIPPGYAPPSYYYPAPSLPGGYSYPPMIPLGNLVPQVTNAGGSTATSQFPKSATYGYGSGTATQDFSKAYVGASQTQNKGSVSATSSVSSASDLTAGTTTGYPKTHSQAFDKTAFATGTPPPFNMTGLPSGTQAGPMGAPAYVQYVPGLAAQPQAQMLAHQLHQDGMGGSSRGAQQSSSQAKSLTNKSAYGATAYWGTN